METWLDEHEYESITQLTGSISQQHAPDPASDERANYSKTLNTFKLSTENWH
jgi:dihydroorotate dehydrogenase (fumarate)